MEFDPKLTAQAQPERLVGAATERGPIGPSTPVNTLTKASRDQVAQSQGDISKLDDDRPVPKVDVFGAIASIASSVGQGISAGSTLINGPPQTQADKDNAALKPLAKELNRLQLAKSQGKAGIGAKISLTTSTFISNNPRLQGQALDLVKNLTGIDTLIKPELSVEDINRQNISDFLSKTPEGRVVAARAANMPVAEQRSFIDQNFNRAKVQEAIIEQANIRLQSVKDNQELLKIDSDVQSQAIAKDQSLRTQELLNNEILPDVIDPAEPFDAFEDMASLRELRELKAAEYRAEYGANVLPADVEKRLNEVLEPLDRMIGMLEENGDDINKLAKIQGNQAVLELGKLLQDEGFGPIFQTPDGIRAITEGLIYQDLLDIPRVAQVYKEKYRLEDSGKISEAPVSDEGDTSSTLTDKAKEFFFGNPDARKDAIKVSSDVMTGPELNTPENIQTSFDAGIELIGLISAGDDVLDDEAFGEFVDKNLFRFSELATLSGEQGEQFTRALNGMLVKQMAINTWDTKQFAKNLPAGFVLNYGGKFKLEFNMNAFNNAEDQVTERVKTLLKQNGLPVVEENIRAVIKDPISFTKEASGLNSRTFASNTQVLVLANKSFKGIESKINRLNNIDAVAKNVPTIKNWEQETDAAVVRTDKEFRNSDVTKSSIITEEDLREVQKKRESYPKFDSPVTVEEALAKGELSVGDLVNINGEIYVLEE